LVQKIVILGLNFRFKPLFRAKRVIYPSGKEKPATGLEMGKTKKAGVTRLIIENNLYLYGQM
jgi:hypothetical protein